MANKKLSEKMIYLVLLFSIMVIGCDNGLRAAFQNNDSAYNNKYEQFLRENSISINYSNEKFYVSKDVNENGLISFLELLKLDVDIAANNIANASATKTYEGGPFIRDLLTINNGNIEIIKDSSPTRYVYDPTHPDSIVTGKWKGYVEYSNVDIVTEMTNVIAIARIYENIMEECDIRNIHKQILTDYD
jgi:flagellar basal-body rod protein FlgC